ncbi:MAG: 3'-5' exonuclease [Myxococcales bacterium]|nr:3'-5' exonuclease [Myxococcales bacterium]
MSSSTREPPPQGPPWDAPLAEAPLAFVDLEMTGLDPEQHRVIEICIERVVAGQTVDRLCSFVDPGEAPLGGTEIHGITIADLEGAPDFARLAPRLDELLRGAILVAHATRYDVAFLTAELARLDRRFDCPHYLDTLAMARKVVEAPQHGLIPLAAHLGVDNPRPHRADNDVAVTRAIFEILASRLQTPTPRRLWEVGRGARRVRPEHLERARQALDLRQPARVCYRPSTRAPEELLFVVTGVRSDLDPPVVLGYLLDTRGRRELRADRILSFELVSETHET